MAGFKIAEAFVEIKGDKGKFSATVRGAKRETASFATSAKKSLKQVSIGLAGIAVAATAAGIAISIKLTKSIISAGNAAVQAAVKYDKLKRGLVAVSGSAEEANAQFIRLRKVAELPGLSFEAALQGSINLQAAGISAGLAERALSAFGNALVTVGKGSADLSGVNLALTQIANKTSGFGQDVRQLQERLPQMQTALKNAFDGKPLEDLNITGKELVEALVVEFEKLPKAAGGIANSIENLSISFDLLKNSIGQKLLPATDGVLKSLTNIIEGLTVVVENYETFKDEAARVFRDIGIIGINLTGSLFSSMIKIVVSVGKIVFVPLKFAMIKAMADIRDAAEIGMINVIGFLTRRSQDITDLLINAVENARVEWDINFKQMEKVEFGDVILKQTDVMIKNFTELANTIITELGRAETVVNRFKKLVPEVEIIPAEDTDSAVKNIHEVLIATEKLNLELFTLDALGKKLKDIFLGIRIKEGAVGLEGFKKRLERDLQGIEIFTLEDVKDEIARVNKEINDNRVRENLKTINILLRIEKDRITKLTRIWDDWTGDIQKSFTNSFADMLDKGRADWGSFAKDLKKIFIRQLTEIAVSQAFKGLFALLNRLDRAVLRPLPPVGPAGGPAPADIGPAIFGSAPAGTRMAPGAPGMIVILPNADVQHMSSARAEMLMERQLEPARRRLIKRGIIPAQM